jgi:hypothetical protein
MFETILTIVFKVFFILKYIKIIIFLKKLFLISSYQNDLKKNKDEEFRIVLEFE